MLTNVNKKKRTSNFVYKPFSKKNDVDKKFENVAKKIIKCYHKAFDELAK